MARPSMPIADLANVLDAMREGLQVIGPDWEYRYLNATAAAHGRRSREELLGRTMMECYPGIDQTEMFAFLRRCRESGQPGEMWNRFTYPDGKAAEFELRAQPLGDDLVVLSLDVSARASLEAQLRHGQKMEAVGRLAGGIAHDFNNLLTVISGAADFALADAASPEAVQDELERVQAAVQRAATLTRQLLALSRAAPTEPASIDLGEVVRETDRLLARLLGEDVQRVVRCEPGLWRTWIDRNAFEQVLLNLVLNARDAMPEGGRLTIEVRNVSVGEEQTGTARAVRLAPGDYVQVAVTDTGHGMPPEVLARVFEPFFTTKRERGGTGLGLATSYGIVRQAGGVMWPYSEVGSGTTFRIYLPRTVREARAVAVPLPDGDLYGTEIVLVVEDDPAVRALTLRALSRYGYQVEGCGTVGEAIARFESGLPLDAVLTDMVLPDRSGIDLAGLLRARRSGFPVVFMSGYTEHAVADRVRSLPGAVVVEKPFLAEALARQVRRVLDAGDR